MKSLSRDDITLLHQESAAGSRDAADKLVQHVYQDLRRMAQHYMRGERPDHTLQATALINEAYMRLANYQKVQWQDRNHFLAFAAQAMRRVLVEHARGRLYAKRAATMQDTPLENIPAGGSQPGPDLLALDDALAQLEAVDPRKCRIVELRFIAGLSIEETASVLSISSATVEREWRAAKAWLSRMMTDGKKP
jgi:RNA polymerase sigma factor (TIGR02999 family)